MFGLISMFIMIILAQTDTANFVECLHGPNTGCVVYSNEIPDFTVWTCRGMAPDQFAACQEFDLDADNDMDLADFATFQNQYNVSVLEFNPAGERIMQIYLDPLNHSGYDALPLISTLNDEFTAICLHGWSWHLVPDMFDGPEIQQAITDIKTRGFKLVIGRNLWTSWPEEDSWAASRALVFDDKWIREELEASIVEKEKYGAWATYVDIEPYGQKRMVVDGSERVFEGSRHILKAQERTHGWELGMTIHERRVFAETLRRVQESTGLIWDFVYPSASSRSEGFHWACREIGKYPCNSKCYYLTDITDRIAMGADPGYPRTVDVWFSAVTNPPTMWNSSTTLSPDQVRHIWSQFEQGKVLYPELKAFMVYSGAGSKAVLEAFQQPSG